MKSYFNQNKLNFFFLIFILFFGYAISYIIFKDLTTFYHDNLDSIVVYNQVIGKIYSGEYKNADIFLNGELKYYYLRHFFKPFILIYSIFNTETAYYLSCSLIKLIAFFSFLKFSRKFSQDKFSNALFSALYASSLNFYTLGFGTAVLPYLLYLICFKEKFKFTNYLVIFFAGLNTDFAADIFILPIILSMGYIINSKNLKKNLKIIFIFYFFSFITSLNLLYVLFFEGPFHRSEFKSNENSILYTFQKYFFQFFKIPKSLKIDWTWIRNFPASVLILLSIFLLIITKDKKALKIFFLILIINFIVIISYFWGGTFFGIRFSSILLYEINLCVILIFLCFAKLNFLKKFLYNIFLLVLFFYQIQSSIVPFVKKNILKLTNYRNIYTFNGYYMYDDYKKIKKITQKEKVISVGFDALIAVMNDINVIDGYHELYQLSYKKKFREIISEELKKNKEIRNYFDNWGNRIYAFYSDVNNINLDYLKAYNLGAKYVISNFELKSKNLSFIPIEFENKIYLYKISLKKN